MSVTEIVQDELRWGHKMLVMLWRFTPSKLLRTDRDEIVIALASLALEHVSSVLLLLSTDENNGSAFALARPTIEAALRAVWLYVGATDDQVLRARTGHKKAYRSLSEMSREIDRIQLTDGLFEHLVSEADGLHGLTHGGLEQVGRRFDKAGDVVPTYDEGSVRECIRSVVNTGTVMLLVLCRMGITEQTAAQAKVDEYQAAFNPMLECLQPIPTRFVP